MDQLAADMNESVFSPGEVYGYLKPHPRTHRQHIIILKPPIDPETEECIILCADGKIEMLKLNVELRVKL